MKSFLNLFFVLLFLMSIPNAYSFRFPRRYFANMRANQVMVQRLGARPDSETIEKRDFQKPILFGRLYLEKKLNEIYDVDSSVIDKNLIQKMSFFGDGCDPYERSNLNYDRTGRVGCIDTKTIPDIRKNSSVVREGWRIATCKELNVDFSESQKPLNLVSSMFSSIEVTDESIQYAYHLFNPYLKVPKNTMLSLTSLMTQTPNDPQLRRQYRYIRGDLDRKLNRLSYLEERMKSGRISSRVKISHQREIERIKKSQSYELLTTQRMSREEIWEFIFYTFCVDPNNQII